MKIATITTHAALNYGAVLQAYALSRYLSENVAECEILDYQPAYVGKSYRLISAPHSVSGLALAAFQMLHYGERKERKERFEAFRSAHLHLTREIATHDELVREANRYDVIVCGSDQIWSPVLHEFDPAYFMALSGVTPRCISYAASFGQDVIPDQYLEEIRARLAHFEAFGAREYTAQTLIQQLTGRTATMVLDPVFLLSADVWRMLAECSGNTGGAKRYCLSYFLSNPAQSPNKAKDIQKKYGLDEVLSIGFSPRDGKYGLHCAYNLGPVEFLEVVDKAECVMTNSFHCAAFSIIFHKPFYVRLTRTNQARNDRIISLLRMLGLEDRAYTEDRLDAVDFERKIDYISVERKMQDLIVASQGYLVRALEKAGGKTCDY